MLVTKDYWIFCLLMPQKSNKIECSTLYKFFNYPSAIAHGGNTKGGNITVPLTSYLTGLESAVWIMTVFVFICKTG